MSNWKKSLDIYLSAGPPHDGFDGWCDEVIEKNFTPEFWDKNEGWIMHNTHDCEINILLERLFNEGFSPEEAAIEIMEWKNNN